MIGQVVVYIDGSGTHFNALVQGVISPDIFNLVYVDAVGTVLTASAVPPATPSVNVWTPYVP